MESELVDLERRYWQALQDGDADTALALTDDPCIVAGAQGVASLDRDTMAGMLKQGSWKLRRFSIDPDVKLKMIGDDAAILAYTVHEELTVDDRPVKLQASDASTWVRRDGRWVCALHTEALAGDAFGRDRRETV
ncbi:MAG TPA: nuclear transport factor 2 family protein [Polyangia bacterium]|nr:nuclear transport factor 2 family protein [Polyangia bacterium]